jgi:agmatinase
VNDLDRPLRLSSQLVRMGEPGRAGVAHAKIKVLLELGEDGWALLDQFRTPIPPRALLERLGLDADARGSFELAIARLVEAGLLVGSDETEYLYDRWCELAAPHWPTMRRAGGGLLGADDGEGPADFHVFGVPLDRASFTPGAARGARAIREASSALPAHLEPRGGAFRGLWDHERGRLVLAGARLLDHGDVYVDPASSAREAFDAVHSTIRRRLDLCPGVPVFLGGDHSITEPILRALVDARGPVFLVHFDAHTDMSPAFRGRPHHHGSVMDLVRRMDGVAGILQVGVRDLGPPWWTGAPKTVVLSADRARSDGELLRHVPADAACYVSVDVDVLDPSEAPGVAVPVPGGLRLVELERMLQALGGARAVAGVDLVEVVPDLDRGRVTAAVAARLLVRLLDAVHVRARELRGRA